MAWSLTNSLLTGNFFSLLLCSLWWVQIFGYALACRSYSFVLQYTISLSSLCKLIWRHWTYKMPVRYILSGVWVRLSIFSPLSIIKYVGLYVFSLPIFLVMIERIYILCFIIIIKSEVWNITHCLGLGHETRLSAVCLSIFLLAQVMACCLTAPSHYMDQRCTRCCQNYNFQYSQGRKFHNNDISNSVLTTMWKTKVHLGAYCVWYMPTLTFHLRYVSSSSFV